MTGDHYPLELSPDQLRDAVGRVLDLLTDFVGGLDQAPSTGLPAPEALLAAVSRPPPSGPGELAPLLDLARRAAAASVETAGPSYLAYIPGGGLLSSVVAELLSQAVNRYTGKAGLAPALVALEGSVLRWMCDLFGFPAGAQGLLTTGGSLANLIGLAAARAQHAEGQVDRACIYVGEHAHGSVAKAARTLGFARQHIRTVRSTPDLRMDVEHLRSLVRADRQAGLVPVCACAAAGTTNTGTVDPLDEVADLARDEGIWFHVDGAYGGFLWLTERGRARLAGLERADSITLDPHKSLFLPYGTGAVVVRSAEALRRTFTERADYLQDLEDPDALPDFDSLGPELTREARGLRLWLPLHLHGVDAFRQQLDEKLDLARMAYESLSTDPRFEVPWEPDLSVIAFRLAGADDEAQRHFLERVNASRRVHLSSTRLEGRFYLRIAILSFRTHADRIRELLGILSREADPARGG